MGVLLAWGLVALLLIAAGFNFYWAYTDRSKKYLLTAIFFLVIGGVPGYFMYVQDDRFAIFHPKGSR